MHIEHSRLGGMFCFAALTLLPACMASAVPAPEEPAAWTLDAAPGSSAPNLARGPDGTLVLSWLETEGRSAELRFSTLEPEGWGPPRTVAGGDDWFVNWADFPSVVPISENLWAAHWLQLSAGGMYTYDVAIALSRDGGETWDAPVTPHRDGTASEHGFVSLFPWHGGVGAVWLDGRRTVSEEERGEDGKLNGMTLRSAVLSPAGDLGHQAEIDGLVCDCCQTDVAIPRSGPVVVYRDRTEAEIRDIQVALTDGGRWLDGHPVAEDGWEIAGCPVNGPALAAREDTVAVAWFTMAANVPRVRYARSMDGGRSFEPPVDLATDSPEGRVGVVLLDDGGAVVSWLDNPDGKGGELVLRHISADGTPGRRRVIARTEVTRPAGFPQLAVSGEQLIAAWTDSSGDKPRVRTARVSLTALRSGEVAGTGAGH
ncbi:sialidase family protein [Elongatibacter sediminis]|uniref:Sialidase family protein n=1 Tax=Elongatibacter sediminis TaxID=3119006 RepID=A0AAW9RFR4_9GAMM